ncbi:hypothetical protein ER308_00075 [Egibacter rhizosphaerae]|uniref:DUF4157 domain-containing protein n=1 Tax=Egibacter rhizosphaerae TaxID=1670831 RepID=A0A411YA78_9ACTN|nr:hypothetical protein [Egibacter rhizosphaerae]QBI18123.1 hypothetical protein ER308_00075 [Egibacter rhizosphaerae]
MSAARAPRAALALALAAAAVVTTVGRRGRRDAPSLLPLEHEPDMLARLARWDPSPPLTRSSRFAARAWAAPLTVAGLLAGASTRGRWRPHGDLVVVESARGALGQILAHRGFSAMTLGHVVVAVRPPEPRLLAHERVHVRQAERLGPLFGPAYLLLLLVYGYRAHPLERAAERSAWAQVPGPASGD